MQRLDKEMYVKIITERLLRSILTFLDDRNIDISSLQKREEELQTAIQSSTIALLIVSANFLASDFIAEYELPKILSRAQTGEVTVMTIIAAPCLLKDSVIQVFQLINPPSKPLSEMTTSEQERTFVKLAEAISQKLM